MFYINLRAEKLGEMPGFFKNIDKYKVTHSQRWICQKCMTVTDEHNGECEFCGGQLVVYKCNIKSSSNTEASYTDKYDLINFKIDFERMLKKFKPYEVKLIFIYGHSGYRDTIDYIVSNIKGMKYDDKLARARYELDKVKIKLEDILVKTEYMDAKFIDLEGSCEQSKDWY